MMIMIESSLCISFTSEQDPCRLLFLYEYINTNANTSLQKFWGKKNISKEFLNSHELEKYRNMCFSPNKKSKNILVKMDS